MLAITKSMALQGLDGYLVSIQVDISNGMPDFQIVRFTRCECKRIQREGKNGNQKFKYRIFKQKNCCEFISS